MPLKVKKKQETPLKNYLQLIKHNNETTQKKYLDKQ